VKVVRVVRGSLLPVEGIRVEGGDYAGNLHNLHNFGNAREIKGLAVRVVLLRC